MLLLIRRAVFVSIGLVSTTMVGCASVDPQPDYQRAAKYVRRSTGNERLFDPGQREADGEYVRTRLADGLTVDEAAQISLLNNPGLQAALYEIGAARADLVQSGLLSNPSLGMALRLPSAGGLANIDLDLAQNIADLWQIPVRQRAAQRNLERTILTIARQAAGISALAKSAYYAAVGADRRLQIARENREVSHKVIELTKFRRQAGAGSELDVNLARGVVLAAELAVTRARLAAASRRRTLAMILGLAVDTDELDLADSLPAPPSHVFDDEKLVDTAWVERLDVRALRQSIRGAEQRLILEFRRVFPTVELGLAMERDARRRTGGRNLLGDTVRSSIASGGLSAPGIQPRSERKRAKTEDVITGPLLLLELPIFDQNQAQIAKAKYELEQRLRLLEGLQHTVRQEVREAVDQARTAWDVARFYSDQVVPQAEKNLKMSRDSYHAGRSGILSVLDAERTYLTARDLYAEALQTAAATVPALEETVGLPLARLLEMATAAATTRPAPGPTETIEGRDATSRGVEP